MSKSRNGLGFGAVRFVVVSAGCGDYNVVDTFEGRKTVAVVEGYAAACAKADELEKAAK